MFKMFLRKILLLMVLSSVILAGCGTILTGNVVTSKLPRDHAPQVADTDLSALADGNNAFAIDLYHHLDTDPGNVFFSPYSISTALAMTYAGARGTTESQMAQAMHYSLAQAQLHPAFNKLALELDTRSTDANIPADKAFKLHVANATWGQDGYTFLPEYLDTLALNYGAGLRLLDFMSDPESARQTINQWVSKETENKINDIIPQGAIDQLTRLVLSNAIFFKGDWQSEFTKDATQLGTFTMLEGGTTTVPMMHQEGQFRYVDVEGFQALEMAYAGGQLSMVIILPEQGKFSEVASSLSAAGLDNIMDNLQYTLVALTMPKFKFEYDLGLNGVLKEMGMLDAFDPSVSDFSGMDGSRDLYISDVLHKAFVAVDEAGTEAAAATVVIVGTTAMPVDQPIEFKADRPFIFAIRDNPTGTILFLGRLMNPAPEK
jgi:serpin B